MRNYPCMTQGTEYGPVLVYVKGKGKVTCAVGQLSNVNNTFKVKKHEFSGWVDLRRFEQRKWHVTDWSPMHIVGDTGRTKKDGASQAIHELLYDVFVKIATDVDSDPYFIEQAAITDLENEKEMLQGNIDRKEGQVIKLQEEIEKDEQTLEKLQGMRIKMTKGAPKRVKSNHKEYIDKWDREDAGHVWMLEEPVEIPCKGVRGGKIKVMISIPMGNYGMIDAYIHLFDKNNNPYNWREKWNNNKVAEDGYLPDNDDMINNALAVIDYREGGESRAEMGIQGDTYVVCEMSNKLKRFLRKEGIKD